jgi:hypothetical protein
MHWGIEQHRYPSPEQRLIARRMSESGACLVLGHHPHVVQGMERIGGSAVAYSLGNFVLDDFVWRAGENGAAGDRVMSMKPVNRIGAVLEATIEGGRVAKMAMAPTLLPHGGTVIPAATATNRRTFRRLNRRLGLPFYTPLWHLHAAGKEWELRIRPNLAPSGLFRKLRGLRLRHLREIGGLLRRSARVVAGRATNPYE